MEKSCKMLIGRVLGGVVLLGLAGDAIANEAHTGEPPQTQCEHSKLNTQDADPLGKGAWQVQFNALNSQAGKLWDSSWTQQNRGHSYERGSNLAVTHGVSDKLDMGASIGYSWLADDDAGLEPGNGPTDIALSAKWRFYENEHREFALAFVPSVMIPTGAKTSSVDLGPSQEVWSMDARFAIVKDWEGGLSTNGDLGYAAVLNDPGDSRGNLGANLAASYHLFSRFQPELEVNYSRDLISGAQDADLLSITAGAEMPIAGLLCARAGVQIGVAGRNTDRATTASLSIDLNL